MGKKVRKKARSSQKEKHPSSSPSKAVAVPQENNLNAKDVALGNPVEMEKRVCVHLEKAIDLIKVIPKIESVVSIDCEDCKEGSIDRRTGKSKGKHTRKKRASDSRPDSKATWVCLQCGHFTCGGIGLPTTPHSHAVFHASHSRHPLVIQVENPHLTWCFSCAMLIPVDKLENTGEHKEVLSDIVKLLKKKSSKESTLDVEETWSGSGSARVVSELKSDTKAVVVVDGKKNYAVRGLVNLGNTCFFNSVLQNLLAMDIFREYLLKYDGSMGPLTSSLKKIFVELNPGTGLRNVINPKPLFGYVCAKAPQFRGHQQQDSHELLRYLLDGLSTEELYARKHNQSSSDNRESKPLSSTFIDTIFGGQLSSTVCCIECGHSSVVYEPFMDLSLPVPTKKPPPKKAIPGHRTRKTKGPPKRVAMTRPKLYKHGDSISKTNTNGSNLSSDNESSALNGDYFSSSSGKHENLVTSIDGIAQNSSNSTERECFSMLVSHCGEQRSEQVADCLAWLDYLEQGPLLNDQNLSLGNEDLPLNHASNSKEVDWHAAEDTAKSNVDLRQESSMQVHDNETLLLTYKEDSATTTEGINVDVQSSSVSGAEDALVFDGLGDLFNEPEVDVPTPSVTNGFQASENLQDGRAGNSSDSDVNEVDNTDSPASIISCLEHFIKPELLSGEHAWHCENCSKLLKENRQMVNQFKASSVSQKNMPNDEYSGSEVLQITSPPSSGCCTTQSNGSNAGDGSVKSLDAMQINGLFLNSIQEKEEFSKPDENSKNGNNVLDGNVNRFDTVQVYEPCLMTVTSIQETEGCSKQENMHSDAPGGSNFVRPTDVSTYSKSINMHIVSANDCVETFSRLDGESKSESEVVDSKSAKAMRDATIRILINKVPPILTIHLKRFSQDALGRLSKLNGYVGFTEYIDLEPYLDSRPIERGSHIYRLIGVVEHSGSMRGGHYITYVRGGDGSRGRLEEKKPGSSVWYYASDVHVRETTLEEVLRCEAYLLFYEQFKP